MKTFIGFFLLFCFESILANTSCISPSPDSYRTSRAPEFVGTVKAIINSETFLVSNKQFKTIRVKFNKTNTTFFTQFGGLFFFNELKVGDNIEIWTMKCVPFSRSKIMLADKVLVHK